MPRTFIRFSGKFRDLKPIGFKFWKAFARNYRVYTWEREEYSQHMNVWQQLGGYVEIADLHSLSYLVLQGILNGSLDKIESGRTNRQYWLQIDLKNLKLVDTFKDPEHKKERGEKYYQIHVKDENYNKELVKEYYSRWRELILSQDIVDKLKEMLSKGWLSIETEKEKSI